jgi:hypothetical protein
LTTHRRHRMKACNLVRIASAFDQSAERVDQIGSETQRIAGGRPDELAANG